MKRPMLICGITITTVGAFLVLFQNTAIIVTVTLSALVFILYLIKPLKLQRHIIIPTICVLSIVISLYFGIYNEINIAPALQYDGRVTNISGKVATPPEESGGYIKFTLETDIINHEKVNIKTAVSIPVTSENTVELYDYVSLSEAELSVPRNNRNDYAFSEASDGTLLNAYSDTLTVISEAEPTPRYYLLKFREAVNEQIDLFLGSNSAGILKGMLFGGSTQMEKSTLNAFRTAGIAHLLAVSGLHTSLWCGLILSFLNLFNANKRIKSLLCIMFLAVLCVLSGFTPSVVRASLMMLLVLIAPFFKKNADSFNSLGAAVTVILLCNPYAVASISFQLSASATAGVLTAVGLEQKIKKATEKIKFRPLKAVVTYVISSLAVSAFASLFTMPVSAYHFGTFCLLAPVTNLLCIQLAFYGMICGVVAVAFSFVNLPVLKDVSLFIFDLTELILGIVTKFATKISEIKFCTVPVHKPWLILALFISAVIIFAGFMLSKIKIRRSAKAIISILVIFSIITVNLIPVAPFSRYSDTVTVVSSGNNINVIVRSGLHYAYIVDITDQIPDGVYDYLPKATCEALDYLFVPYLPTSALYQLPSFTESLKPAETHVNKTLNLKANSYNVTLPQNTILKLSGNYFLSDKINIEIVDTYRIQYAIIRGNEKTVYVHLHGSTDFSDFVDVSSADIIVYKGTVPEATPQAGTVIVSADSDCLQNSNLSELKNSVPTVYVTATDGDIQLTI